METVTENKVLNQEELQTLKTIQDETQSVIIELGEIELIQMQLNERKEKAKQFLNKVSKKEQIFTQSIFEKYGKCNINPQTGEITSIS
jgi:ribosome-binding ATPase YchF (GTP1/OBG family)